MISNTPKGRCQVCSKKFVLILKGQTMVVPAHLFDAARCTGTNKEPQ
jgi:hypothetical protein